MNFGEIHKSTLTKIDRIQYVYIQGLQCIQLKGGRRFKLSVSF